MAAQNLILAFEAVDITTRLTALHLSQDVAVQTAKFIIDVLLELNSLDSHHDALEQAGLDASPLKAAWFIEQIELLTRQYVSHDLPNFERTFLFLKSSLSQNDLPNFSSRFTQIIQLWSSEKQQNLTTTTTTNNCCPNTESTESIDMNDEQRSRTLTNDFAREGGGRHTWQYSSTETAIMKSNRAGAVAGGSAPAQEPIFETAPIRSERHVQLQAQRQMTPNEDFNILWRPKIQSQSIPQANHPMDETVNVPQYNPRKDKGKGKAHDENFNLTLGRLRPQSQSTAKAHHQMEETVDAPRYDFKKDKGKGKAVMPPISTTSDRVDVQPTDVTADDSPQQLQKLRAYKRREAMSSRDYLLRDDMFLNTGPGPSKFDRFIGQDDRRVTEDDVTAKMTNIDSKMLNRLDLKSKRRIPDPLDPRTNGSIPGREEQPDEFNDWGVVKADGVHVGHPPPWNGDMLDWKDKDMGKKHEDVAPSSMTRVKAGVKNAASSTFRAGLGLIGLGGRSGSSSKNQQDGGIAKAADTKKENKEKNKESKDNKKKGKGKGKEVEKKGKYAKTGKEQESLEHHYDVSDSYDSETGSDWVNL